MVSRPEQAFSYHRAVAPMLWVFVVLASVELIVVHLLVAHWNGWAALAMSALTVAGVVWLVAAILSFRRLPVLITPDALLMRVGSLRSVAVPLAQVAGLRESWDGPALARRNVLNLALVAYPNVVVDLKQPLPGRRQIAAFAHRLDDPAAFAAALARIVPAK